MRKHDRCNTFRSWKAPAAELKDEDGKVVGKHSAGPTWEDDAGKVVGARSPVGILPKEGTIPWLLIKTEKTEGKGTFAKVAYVQRVDTVGGRRRLNRSMPSTPAPSCACGTRRRTSSTGRSRTDACRVEYSR